MGHANQASVRLHQPDRPQVGEMEGEAAPEQPQRAPLAFPGSAVNQAPVPGNGFLWSLLCLTRLRASLYTQVKFVGAHPAAAISEDGARSNRMSTSSRKEMSRNYLRSNLEATGALNR